MRWHQQIPKPLLDDGEIAVHELAERLRVGTSVIYRWIKAGKLQARRNGRRKLAITFNDEIETACHKWIQQSIRIHPRTQESVAGGAV
jgi:excisionase family DNA binding protein